MILKMIFLKVNNKNKMHLNLLNQKSQINNNNNNSNNNKNKMLLNSFLNQINNKEIIY